MAEGCAYVEAELGVALPPGGEHPRMGTHNHLMQLSATSFLEVIAINPTQPVPNRPRWFALDDPHVQQRLRREPQLLTWVVNTTDLATTHRHSLVDLGEIIPQTRGELNWLITVPNDGHLPGAGFIPTAIQWQVADHPAQRMSALGCSLASLRLYHPYTEWLTAALAALGAANHVSVHPLPGNSLPYMVAEFITPNGLRRLTTESTSHHQS